MKYFAIIIIFFASGCNHLQKRNDVSRYKPVVKQKEEEKMRTYNIEFRILENLTIKAI